MISTFLVPVVYVGGNAGYEGYELNAVVQQMLKTISFIFSVAFKTQIYNALLFIVGSQLSPKLEHLGALNLLYT